MERKETDFVRDETSGTVREESTVVDDTGPTPKREASVVTTSTPARRLTDGIYLLFGIIDALLIVRLTLKLLGANPEAGFSTAVYGVTDLLLAPFHGLLPIVVSGRSVLEISLLIAILIYSLAALGLARIAAMAVSRNVTVSHHSRSEGLKTRAD